VIRCRLDAARVEIARGLASYEYVVVNGALDEAVERIAAILRHARAELAGRPDPHAARIAAESRRHAVAAGAW
jgi:guanylate kinase